MQKNVEAALEKGETSLLRAFAIEMMQETVTTQYENLCLVVKQRVGFLTWK